MAKDPYQILGVDRLASEDQIRVAYRKLAKQNHPDLNQGDAGAEARFKEIQTAFDIVGDADKRGRYDRGEIDADGNDKPRRADHRDYARGAGRGGFRGAGGGAGSPDLDSVFADLFGANRAGTEGFVSRGADRKFQLTVDFVEAARGAKKRVTLPDGSPLDVTIPAGLRDGQTLRLRGLGQPGMGGGPAGDALVTVTVQPHPSFERQGDDILLDLPVTLAEALLGASVTVPTLDGTVNLTIPAGSNSGKTLRLKGKGINGGNQLVRLSLRLPDQLDTELVDFVRQWSAKNPYNPRKG